MKIGIDGRLWNETGVGRYIRNLVENLSKIDSKNSYVLFVNKNAQINNLPQKENWEIVPISVSWHSLGEQLVLPPLLAKYSLDLMHFPYFSVPIMYSKPYVVTIHDLIIDHFPTGKASTHLLPLYFIKRFFYQQIVRSAVTNAKALIVPSHATEQELKDHYNALQRKVFVTYEGYEKVKMSEEQNISDKYFLYVGNAYPHKNLERLLDAFGEYKKEFANDIKLYLVGKKDYFYVQIEKKIEKLGLKKEVKIFNSVTDEKLVAFYENAQALFAPSLMEGFGLTPLEALSNKCLCAVSDIPSFHEVSKNAVLYFDPYSIESIKKMMVKVTNLSPQDKKDLLMKGAQRAREFSWMKMAQETLEIYENSTSVRSR